MPSRNMGRERRYGMNVYRWGKQMARGAIVLFEQPEGRQLIEKHCQSVGLPVEDLRRLVEEVVDKDSMQRRRGLRQAFDEIFDAPVEQSN
jgi:hypothetical protein